jgi:hypothetical protein
MEDRDLKYLIEREYQLNSFELPEFSRVDSYLVRGNQIKYWVERKVRNVPFDTYPDAVVDFNKWQALLAMEEITTIPAYLAYGWSCGTWGIVRPMECTNFKVKLLTPSLDSVSLNAGVERKVVHIDLSEFKVWK